MCLSYYLKMLTVKNRDYLRISIKSAAFCIGGLVFSIFLYDLGVDQVIRWVNSPKHKIIQKMNKRNPFFLIEYSTSSRIDESQYVLAAAISIGIPHSRFSHRKSRGSAKWIETAAQGYRTLCFSVSFSNFLPFFLV